MQFVIPETETYRTPISSAVIGDVNHDGIKEIFANSHDGKLYGIDTMGNPLPGFPVDLTALVHAVGGDIYDKHANIPALADLNGDGIQEILATIRYDYDNQFRNYKVRLFAIQANGAVHDAWPIDGVELHHIIGGGVFPSSYNQITAADLDQDGQDEVMVTGGSSTGLQVLKGDGTAFNQFFPMPNIAGGSPAAVGDIDQDGKLEIVAGDIADGFIGFQEEAEVHVINPEDGTEVPGWPVAIPTSNFLAPTVSVGDVNGDGSLDVVAAVGTVYPSTPPNYETLAVYAADGSPLAGWPLVRQNNNDSYYFSGIALADLDLDRKLEVISIFREVVYVNQFDGSDFPGWPRVFDDRNGEVNNQDRNVTVSDIDNDGYPDIVYLSNLGLLTAVDRFGNPLPGMPYDFGFVDPEISRDYTIATPVISDVGKDGDVNLIVTSFYRSDPNNKHAQINVFDFFEGTDGNIKASKDWLQFHRDNRHTGLYPQKRPLLISTSAGAKTPIAICRPGEC
ncbi:MAG: hypothetical protein COV74_07335 [Candidatus Omnitrophica bacterium CG11_big_fil_rev_8_21_14_0_20_45_26]|uniref:VCBS repeat-containing protein n=1 Tax=Candidatus Abzuiibacterium crystallinum TaxID=1974748 RepID=A0A2H0LN76_9BACT|nr:MAG: hypothetical protein COV74_07335 [Candidatus Omnitrophica bacterium CG11_big_fil_rev_8_21_14_0_20_45_26]